MACTDDSLIAVEAKGDVEDKSEFSLLVQIAKDIAVLKDQNKELTTELAATKQSVAYLAAQNDDLREQLHNSQPVYSKLNSSITCTQFNCDARFASQVSQNNRRLA